VALGNGGRFTTIEPSLHTKTNIDIIKMFVDCEITTKPLGDGLFELSVKV